MPNVISEYHWKGINKAGKRMQGVIRAIGVQTVEKELQQRQIEVISITEQTKKERTFFKKKIKSKDVVFFTRYLSTMLSASLPILKSLDVISQDPDNEKMQAVVMSIRNDIFSGKALSDTLSQYPKYFNGLYCNLVRAGERSGTLDKILKRLAAYLEKVELLKSKLKKALIYPIAIVVVSLVVAFILMVFVMPQFEIMFQNSKMKLPLFTQIVINLSHFVQSFWWVIVLLFGGATFGMKYMVKRNEKFAYLRDKWLLKIPLLRTIIKKAIIARFTSTLAITIDAGLPIVDSMKSKVLIMGNRVYSKAITVICDDVSEGQPLSAAMERTNLFPNMVIQMVAVGEASGTLSEMLNNVARYYEEEVNGIVDNFSALLEPIIIIILGVMIGAFIVAMYLPIFKMGALF